MIAKNKISIVNLKGARGITLTELLVATIMIGIVMIGVAAFSGSIVRLQGSTSRSTLVAMRVKAVMARIKQDAFLAVGDNEDCGKDQTGLHDENCGWGIRVFSGGDKSICFRHDVLATPEIYTDDQWICYFQNPANARKSLYYCGITPVADVPMVNQVRCDDNGGSQRLLHFWQDEDDFFQVVENAAGQLKYVEFTISTIYYEDIDDVIPAHPMTNPTYVLTTRVSPPGHSR